MTNPRLSIVIPTYNGWQYLRRCLITVEKYRPADSEVIIVDDGSRDGTYDEVTRRWPGFFVLRTPRNRGFCAAANLGLANSRGEIVELLNNDTEVTEGWAEAALRPFADPQIGVVAPLVFKMPFRRRIDSAGDNYHWIGVAKKRAENVPWSESFDVPLEVFGASASSAFYRRTAIVGTGGFPEHFGAYLDDIDLGLRIRLAGFRCLFEPSSHVYHWVSRSHATRGRRIQHQVARNSERVFWVNTPLKRLLWMGPAHLAFVLVQLAYKFFKGDFGSWFAGKCSLLAEIPQLLRQRQWAQSLAKQNEGKTSNRNVVPAKSQAPQWKANVAVDT